MSSLYSTERSTANSPEGFWPSPPWQIWQLSSHIVTCLHGYSVGVRFKRDSSQKPWVCGRGTQTWQRTWDIPSSSQLVPENETIINQFLSWIHIISRWPSYIFNHVHMKWWGIPKASQASFLLRSFRAGEKLREFLRKDWDTIREYLVVIQWGYNVWFISMNSA